MPLAPPKQSCSLQKATVGDTSVRQLEKGERREFPLCGDVATSLSGDSVGGAGAVAG